MYDDLVKRLRLAKAVLSRNKDLIALLSDAADAIENMSEAYDPLISVPDHGRLIDADALMKQVEHDTPLSDVFEKTMRRYLHNAPTIIPAEEGE